QGRELPAAAAPHLGGPRLERAAAARHAREGLRSGRASSRLRPDARESDCRRRPPMTARRFATTVALAAVVLGGCAAIPHSGEVEEGNADVLPVEPLQPIQEGPNPSDEPAAIIVGFLNASAAGVASDFSVAREFLTDDAAASWNPGAQTLVYRS